MMMDDLQTTRPLVYLACPYSHPNIRVRTERYHAANRAAAMLRILHGELVFSPVTHSHAVGGILEELHAGSACDWRVWQPIDEAILSLCHKLYVLSLPGWEQSVGVQAEISRASQMRIEIEMLHSDFVARALNEQRDGAISRGLKALALLVGAKP